MIVHKYPLGIYNEHEIVLPEGFEILCVQLQDNVPTLWIRVDIDASVTQHIVVYEVPTGFESAGLKETKYIGTLQNNGYVMHYFWKGVVS